MLREDGKSIVGNSCHGRSVKLLNYDGGNKDWIKYNAEQETALKSGMVLHGKHIPVVKNEIIRKEKTDYVILVAWNYEESIMEQLRARGLKSTFVIPLPDLTVIEN